MDRFGLFIDAGYLLMAGGEVCLGAGRRNEVDCDYQAICTALVDLAVKDCGLPPLRTYWYDGALGPNAQPTTDHYRIAAIPDVKLRLGRVVHGNQKGVDSLLTRDLMTLARERAMATAYLVTGDEDIREGVMAAQDMGVRVVLVGLPPGRKSRQSFRLINECDVHHAPAVEFWRPYFSRPAAPAAETPPAALHAAQGGNPMSVEDAAEAIGRARAQAWLARTDPETVGLVKAGLPLLPRDIDAPLLREAEARLGPLRDREDLRRLLRNAFVDVLQTT